MCGFGGCLKFSVVLVGLYVFAGCATQENKEGTHPPQANSTKTDSKIIHFTYGRNLSGDPNESQVVWPIIPVKRCVFRVVAIEQIQFSTPSLHIESWRAQLDRIDAYDPNGISSPERYEFYYYDSGITDGNGLQVNNIISITFDKHGIVDDVERIDIGSTKKAKAVSVK